MLLVFYTSRFRSVGAALRLYPCFQCAVGENELSGPYDSDLRTVMAILK
jgi:hypothetical protein